MARQETAEAAERARIAAEERQRQSEVETKQQTLREEVERNRRADIQRLENARIAEAAKAAEARRMAEAAEEVKRAEEAERDLWYEIRGPSSPEGLEDYLKRYPTGKFADLARASLARMAKEKAAQEEARQKQEARAMEDARRAAPLAREEEFKRMLREGGSIETRPGATRSVPRAMADENRRRPSLEAKQTNDDVAATIRVFFGSDRNLIGVTDPEKFYGYQRAAPSFGYSDVTIPHSHKMGNLESPLNLVVWKGSPDPKWHIVVSSISSVSEVDFFSRLREETLKQRGARQAFVFVHGYATTFYDALRRAAQMKYDLQFPGTAILYSWPSAGDESSYGADEDSIAWSAINMREFLRDVAEKSGADEIFLIGHSMGTRGLSSAISAIASSADRSVSSRYKQVILAAPDIDRDIFKDQILPTMRTAGMALTVYASDRDKALDLSRIGHTYPRLGSTSPMPFIAEGLTTIDASGVDTSFWGHSYYAENRSIISDMYYLIRNTPLAQRFGLQSVDGPQGQYWKFRQ